MIIQYSSLCRKQTLYKNIWNVFYMNQSIKSNIFLVHCFSPYSTVEIKVFLTWAVLVHWIHHVEFWVDSSPYSIISNEKECKCMNTCRRKEKKNEWAIVNRECPGRQRKSESRKLCSAKRCVETRTGPYAECMSVCFTHVAWRSRTLNTDRHRNKKESNKGAVFL